MKPLSFQPYRSYLVLFALITLIMGPASIKNNLNRFGLYNCDGHLMTLEQVASIRNITTETIHLIVTQRGLTVEEICIMPQAKLDRAIFRSNNPKPDHPGEAVEFRKLQLQDENGYIPPDGLVVANEHIQAMMNAQGADQEGGAAGISRSSWVWLGPGNIGGRVRTIVIHPANPNILWAGSVSGGIWKSTDGGVSWQILTDFLGNMAVSTLVIDPNDPNTLYAGTGEGFYNIDNIQGAGVFKTTDGGTTWAQLASTNNSNWYFVNRLSISPNGNTILAATSTGIWRSINGGTSWTQALSDWRVKDLNFDPSNNNNAIASGSEGTAWYSTTGGASWTAATGLPTLDWLGRVEVAYAPSNPSIVYASVNQNQGEIWKSANGGQSYSLVNTGNNYVGGQGWYDNIIWVDPTNSNVLLVGGVDIWRSTNGGASLSKISLWWAIPSSAHADHHIILSDPGFDGVSNKKVYFGNDGGVYSTNDVYSLAQLSGWNELNNNLGITQFYGAAGNPKTGEMIGGTQDNGTLFYTASGGTEGWTDTFGGDGGFSAADPTDPNYFYGEYVGLQIHRSTDRGATASFIYSGITDAGSCANFIAPFILDPNNPNTLLAGGCSLWRSTNVKAGTPAWTAIKTATGVEISAIAVAAGNSNIIWVGHNNGDVYKTTNGTSASPTWTKMDGNSPGLPARYVHRITVDGNDPNLVYVTFGGFSADNVWRTTNGGTSWAEITGIGLTGLPDLPVRSLVINPNNSNWLYAGTELGIFASQDGGSTWTVPHDGPSNTSVDELFWMNSALVAATHGRGLFMAETMPCVTLTTTPNPLAGGSISVDPAPNCAGDSTKYSLDSVVTLTAAPNAGYAFSSWSGDASGATTSVDVTLSTDKAVTANFTPTCFTLTTHSNPLAGGTVDASPVPNCAGDPTKYTQGAVVTLTANPNSSYNFASWSGDASGTTNPTTVTMSADRSVTANFSQAQTCYTLTTDSNPLAGGSVDASPAPDCNGTQYTQDTVVTLTAAPNTGYNFASWSGDASGTTNPTTVTMSADRSVTANFSQIQDCYTLITEINLFGGGAVNANPAPNCSTSPTKYATGTQVTLTAVPNAGYAFGNWSGDASGTANPTIVTINADLTVRANFEATCFMLFASPNPAEGGVVNAEPLPNCVEAPGKYARDTLVTLTATANEGYNFLTWNGDASGTVNPTTVTMDADKFVTADFSQTCYALTINSNPLAGGSVNANPAPDCASDSTKYGSGTVVTLTASPAAGYAFSNWSGDASGAINPTTVTMSADRSVTANFTQSCFALTVNSNPALGGSVSSDLSPNCPGDAGRYSAGTQVILTASPYSGYSFTNWSGDASGTTNPTTVTMNADHSVTANFTSACYTLTTAANPLTGGAVSADPSPNCAADPGKYMAGTTVTLTATPNTGYGFTSWSGDASGTANPTTVSMSADKSVTANFTAACYTLTKSANPAAGGSVGASPAPNCAADPAKYTAGTTVTLTATPGAGYAFGNWSGDASGTANPTTVSMSADKSVTANFTASCFTLTKTASPAAGGSISASPAPNCAGVPTKYAAGTVVTLTASANTGFAFSSWSGDASGTANPTTVSMSADRSVTANFSAACYTLTKTANPAAGGSVSASPAPNCNGTQYTYGSAVTLTAHPNANYVFTSWSGHVSGSTNPINLTMTANKSVTANFVSNSTPVVTSIVRLEADPTAAIRVKFAVTFSEPVTGVDTHDFALTTYGLKETFVGSISGEAQTYTVTVNTGTGNGTVRLDLLDNDSIKDSNNTPLGGAGTGNGNFTSGQSYTVVKGATYVDVPLQHWAWQYVERLHNAGVTSGCWENPPYFCPNATVNRAQMAVFLLRSRYGSTYTPPAATGAVFLDVPKDHWAAAWIEQVSREGWTGGCGNNNYCPQTVVTREQVAVFLLIAKHGVGYKPPAATGIFSDVPKTYWAAAWIEQLYREGVTGGCGGNNYCPTAVVTRAQMAVFLVKAFNLP